MMAEDNNIMKKRFNESISMLLANKGKNNQLFTIDQYLSLIIKVKEAKNKTANKTPEDFQRLSRYDVVNIGTSEKLITPVKNAFDPIIFYAHLDETFQIIHDCHINIGHGGRTRMLKELKLTYKNITGELVTEYLNLCESCQIKRKLPRKGLTMKPIIISNELNSRCQVDLIDMQLQADGDYNYIMVYQDHLTKFVQLRSLKSQQTKEIAHHLLDIFTTFGAPSILQSVHGREFANTVIKEVSAMWPELKIVHGKPQLLQSQEIAHQDIEIILRTWLESNKTMKWAEGLRFVQLMKNRTYHAEINRSPYEAMFGCKAKIGLNSFLPQDMKPSLVEITTEEELEMLLNKNEDQKSEARKSENDSQGKMTFEVNVIKEEITDTEIDSDIGYAQGTNYEDNKAIKSDTMIKNNDFNNEKPDIQIGNLDEEGKSYDDFLYYRPIKRERLDCSD